MEIIIRVVKMVQIVNIWVYSDLDKPCNFKSSSDLPHVVMENARVYVCT